MASEDHQPTCTICLEGIDNIGKASFFPCFHGFHQSCFDDYIKDKIEKKRDINCPVCRIIHFEYGDKNYSYIVGQLDCEVTGKTPRHTTTTCNNFIFESPRSPSRRRVETPIATSICPSVTINIPSPQCPRDEVKMEAQKVWYRFRYYIVFIVIVCVLVFVLCMIVKTSSISSR